MRICVGVVLVLDRLFNAACTVVKFAPLGPTVTTGWPVTLLQSALLLLPPVPAVPALPAIPPFPAVLAAPALAPPVPAVLLTPPPPPLPVPAVGAPAELVVPAVLVAPAVLVPAMAVMPAELTLPAVLTLPAIAGPPATPLGEPPVSVSPVLAASSEQPSASGKLTAARERTLPKLATETKRVRISA